MKIWKNLVMLYIGGMLYSTLELLWRGRTHPSMFVVGGICFVLIGALNEHGRKLPLLAQMLLGAGIVTAAELFSGFILNVWLGLKVWDYSMLPLNFMGQISLYFFLLWIPVSAAAVLCDDILRRILFGEPMPHYRLL